MSMSDLRYFAENMRSLISAEARLREIEANATQYLNAWQTATAETACVAPEHFRHSRNEGQNAARIIMQRRQA
jgi:hypothetical protein